MAAYKRPERRRYIRLEADCELYYIKLSDKLKPIQGIVSNGYSKDISAGGIKFIAPEKLAINCLLEIHIKLPTARNFLAAMGKVVRCNPEGKRRFGAALSFTWISKRDRERIEEYVKNKRLEKLRYQIKK